MSSKSSPAARLRARLLYYRARLQEGRGNRERAVVLARQAVGVADFTRAYDLIARNELPGEDYFSLLGRIHQHLRPRNYLEIGLDKGKSLKLVRPETLTLGVDPAPRLKRRPGPNVKVFAETSDDFFARHDVIAELGGERIELAFIDGMHQFEFALRDFINVERLASRQSVVLVHDVYPIDGPSAARERVTKFWSGDIWRLVVLLRKYRPDLVVHTLAAPPSGLAIILNLDPGSRVLADGFDAMVREALAIDYAAFEPGCREALGLFPNDWERIRTLIDLRAR